MLVLLVPISLFVNYLLLLSTLHPNQIYHLNERWILESIDVYNQGKLSRDFTYIDDIVEGVYKLLPNMSMSDIPYQVFNIGRGSSVALLDFIACLEKEIGKKAILNLLPMQPGDVHTTWADTSALHELTGYKPKTSIERGVNNFVSWHRQYSK